VLRGRHIIWQVGFPYTPWRNRKRAPKTIPQRVSPRNRAARTQMRRFLGTASKDPIAGMAHHVVAPCPASDSHHVSGTPFESRKLVNSGTFHLRNDFRHVDLLPIGQWSRQKKRGRGSAPRPQISETARFVASAAVMVASAGSTPLLRKSPINGIGVSSTHPFSRTHRESTDKVPSGQAPETHPFFRRNAAGAEYPCVIAESPPGATTDVKSLFDARCESNVFRFEIKSSYLDLEGRFER
jgi:hypothetical protein